MRKIILITVSALFCTCLFLTWNYYKKNYTLYDVVEDRLVYLNPFTPLQKDRSSYITNLSFSLATRDTAKARFFSEKLLSYRDSYNEKQYEEIFSCHNEYWEYKEKILFEYSAAYQLTGQPDSAFSCLRPLLLGATGYSAEGLKRFFKLQIASKGKNAVIEEIKKGLHATGLLDCYKCPENYFMYSDFKIGISAQYVEMRDTEPQKLLQNLLEEYSIEL